MSGEPPRLVRVNPPEEDAPESSWYSVPSRAVARELKVPPWNPPASHSRPIVSADPGPLRRLSPRKSWPEVAAIDAKLDRIDKQRVGLSERIGRLDRAIREARLDDQQALATWQLGGAQGTRPLAKAPALAAELDMIAPISTPRPLPRITSCGRRPSLWRSSASA